MKHRILALGLVCAGAACGEVVPAELTDASNTDARSGAFTLSAAASEVCVRQGAFEVLTITVERSDGFEGPIDLSVTGLPDALVAEGTTIAADSSEATIMLTDEGANLAAAGMMTVTGTAGDLEHAVEVGYFVAGARGTLDETFGTGGEQVVVEPFEVSFVSAVARDGGIFLGGNGEGLLAVLKLRAEDGTVDGDYGQDGLFSIDGPSVGVPTEFGLDALGGGALAFREDGNLVVASGGLERLDEVGTLGSMRLLLIELDQNGQPSGAFGSGGFAASSYDDRSFAPTSIDVHSGSLWLSGLMFFDGFWGLISRHSGDGSPNSNFNDDGYHNFRYAVGVTNIANRVLGEDGRALISGSTATAPAATSWIYSFTATGALDPMWGEDGVCVLANGVDHYVFANFVANPIAGYLALGSIADRATVIPINPMGEPLAPMQLPADESETGRVEQAHFDSYGLLLASVVGQDAGFQDVAVHAFGTSMMPAPDDAFGEGGRLNFEVGRPLEGVLALFPYDEKRMIVVTKERDEVNEELNNYAVYRFWR